MEQICIDCGSPLKAANRGGVRCGDCNAEYCAGFGGRGPYLPTEEEIEQRKLETATGRLAAALPERWWE